MGHTNSTANLSLPQFIGTDKPTWLGDVNGAFSAIDAYAGTNDAAVAAAASDASSAISQAAAAVSTANSANTTAGNASTAANNAIGVANTANAIAGTVDSKVGLLADLHTTDRTSIVNAINEVKDAEGDLSQLTTSDTSSLVAAINEVAQGGGGSGLTITNLYTNPDPSQNQAAATLATIADAPDYSAYLVIWRINTAADNTSMIALTGTWALTYTDGSGNVNIRPFTITKTGTTLTIAASDSKYSNTTDNQRNIIAAVYGLK